MAPAPITHIRFMDVPTTLAAVAPLSQRLTDGGTPLNPTPGFWSRVKNRVTLGLATQEVLDRLAHVGVVVYPYFVVYEPVLARPEVEMLDRDLHLKLLGTHEAYLV